MASYEAKVSYLTRNLNRQLKNERSFPLILLQNYNQVIRPRGDMLKDRDMYFDLGTAFTEPDDEKFCQQWGLDIEELNKLKEQRKRKNDIEKDYLWSYVHI